MEILTDDPTRPSVAAMSRPAAGSRNSSIIITLPGSPKGAKENLEAILKLLPHACIQAAGLQESRKLHAGGVKKLEAEAGVGVGPVAAGESVCPRREASQTESQGSKPEHHGCSGRHTHHAPKPHTEGAIRTKRPGEGVAGRHRSSPYPMISVEEAQQSIRQSIGAGGTTAHSVNQSLIGHILAKDVMASVPVPAYRASIVDGYAIINSDGPGIYPVISVSHAAPGEDLPTLQPGQVVRVTTGAPVPPGATSIVMVEDTILISSTEDGKEENEIEILASNMASNENIREIGSDVAVGTVILHEGTEVTAAGGEIGIIASVGVSKVEVYKKPIVGVLSTGDEVVNHDRPGDLRIGQIRDSNRPTLIAALTAWGYEVVDFGVADDK